MPVPSTLTRVRHAIGRAFRETGQALDRVGIRGATHAETTRVVDDDPYLFQVPLSRHRNKMPLLQRGQPLIDASVFVAPCSTLIGSVRIKEGASIWYGAILRADNCRNGMGRFNTPQEQLEWEKTTWLNMTPQQKAQDDESFGTRHPVGGAIYIGKNTNVQEGAIITSAQHHTLIGDNVTIGHGAQIHSATVESNCLIGIGAILRPRSKVESGSLIAAGSVLGEGLTVKSGELWAGNPAVKKRDLTPTERDKLIYQAEEYVKLAITHDQVKIDN